MWNPVIQFWHGRPLGRIERLSLASFVAQGHEVRLYSYGPLERVPRGVQCVDAREILPEKRLYFDTRHGSWAQFSDIFRFEALRKLGGLWADSDMIALRPIEKAHEVLIVRESRSQLASALVGIPAGHPLARRLVWGCSIRGFPIATTRGRSASRRRPASSDESLRHRLGGLTLAQNS